MTEKKRNDKLSAETNEYQSDEKFGRDYVIFQLFMIWEHNAEGAVAINSQAKGPNFDDTLESNGAPKK